MIIDSLRILATSLLFIAMMIYKGEHRATLMFNGTTVNVKSTSDPEDIVEKFYLIRKITD